MKVLEDLITPNFDADKIVPLEIDFQKVADAYTDYTLNGKNADFIHLPWNMANSIKDIYKVIRRLIVAAIFKWDELIKELKNACLRLGYSTAELKMLIKYAKDYSNRFEACYDKYCEPVFNGTYVMSVSAEPQNNSSQTTNNTQVGNPAKVKILAKPTATFCRIVAYDPKYGNSGCRRHIYLTKKQNGSYRVSIGGAAVTSWYNEPFFDSIQQAEAFLKNITKANTRTKVLSFDYSITDKPISQYSAVVTDLSDCVLVQSDCGPAYIHRKNQYCVESLSENLEENIEKHNELNPALFNENSTLKPEVKEKINEIVDEFLKDFIEAEIKLNVKDIILTGSNASYNYTKDSDLDVHILADTSEIEDTLKLHKVIYDAYKSAFNKNFEIELNKVPVEIYVETQDTPLVSNGIYSVINDSWVKEPTKEAIPEVDQEAINKAFRPWEKRYNALLTKITDELDDESEIDSFIDKLYDLRKKGLAEDGEYSIGNLVFKEMRNKGYLDHLKELRHKVIAQRLSLFEKLDNVQNLSGYLNLLNKLI